MPTAAQIRMATLDRLYKMSRIYELIYRIPAALFGLADLFGIVFFGATVSLEKFTGPFLMFYIAAVPTKFARANWWLLVVLIGVYLPTYWRRLQSLFPFDDLAMADAFVLAIEAAIVLLCVAFLCMRDGGKTQASKGE